MYHDYGVILARRIRSTSSRAWTTAAHSLLSELTDEDRAQVSAAIVHALDEVERILRSKMATATK